MQDEDKNLPAYKLSLSWRSSEKNCPYPGVLANKLYFKWTPNQPNKSENEEWDENSCCILLCVDVCAYIHVGVLNTINERKGSKREKPSTKMTTLNFRLNIWLFGFHL